jgi:transcriptional regulator with XRE-family HTH domain
MKNQPHAVDIEIGRAIRKRRLLNGVSQSDLGAGIGVTFQQVQKYEKGTNRVSASMLTEIARVLHVDVRSFFDAVEAQDRKEAVDDMRPENLRVTRETVSLTEAFLQISDARLRRKILDLVRIVAGAGSKNDEEGLQDAAE